MQERHYDFRKFLDEVHQKDLRDFSLEPQTDETELTADWSIRIEKNASDFILDTAWDLADYLLKSMSIGVRIVRDDKNASRSIELSLDPALTVKRSFRLKCTAEKIVISGADERGIAMGCYYLE
ncbi:MAG: hypothetical protein IKO93_13545, partial [Lentisphaeria bacterium]|nr:hypothetical protein [Lentisphaeria bacterium]